MKPLLIRRSYAKSLLFLYIKEERIQAFPANDYSFILFGRTNKSYPNDYNNSPSYYTQRYQELVCLCTSSSEKVIKQIHKIYSILYENGDEKLYRLSKTK